MLQPVTHRLSQQQVQISARRVKPSTAQLHIADPKGPSHQMVQRHILGGQVAAMILNRQVYVMIAFERLKGFNLNQGNLPNIGKLRILARSQRITIPFKPKARRDTNGLMRHHRLPSG
jgi:hypothetical protein